MDPVSRTPDASDQSLLRIVSQLAELLPAQGPISIFIHHNTLHAFEELPFETAVERAADRLHREPYLTESRYRDKLAAGRILVSDVEAIVRDHLGQAANAVVAGCVSRFTLWCAVVRYGIPAANGPQLAWLLDETAARSRFRPDLSPPLRALLAGGHDDGPSSGDEAYVVNRLWRACLGAAGQPVLTGRGSEALPGPRHRDLIRAAHQIDTDEWIHPTLIRFVAGFLDQGLAHWPMPNRARGLYACFVELYGTRLASGCGVWAQTLPRLVAHDRSAGRDALASLEYSLAALGLRPDDYAAYLGATLLALRGWAGMIRQIEERPDRVPTHDLTATLVEYLAVRFLLERAALDGVIKQLGFQGAPRDLMSHLRALMPTVVPGTTAERAWAFFNVAQLCGLDARVVQQWTPSEVAEIEHELDLLSPVRRRRLLHEAFERTVRHRMYDALIAYSGGDTPTAPAFQAVFCLDEREESFRRHLEEVDSSCETFSTAGFFNIAMYHQGATDAHPRPLCPVVIRPVHYVAEIEVDQSDVLGRSRRLHRRASGFLGYNVHVGSRLPVHGALMMTALGWLALIPLVARVVFPWFSSRWRRVRESATAPSRTRLRLDREAGPPPIGTFAGFTVREMADIVRRVLEDTGLRHRLSALILLLGHGSISLNNPHESAHDCGACGGGRGGPNARAFAQMANDSRVRALLASQGLVIPEATWFVGAQRNTCNNDVAFYDEDLVPAGHAAIFGRVKSAIEVTRRREAHERCRRFSAVPTWYPPLAALAHVQGRANDLAQPRPEYGHATNAYCIIGRRTRTRGLFLDRRAFLVSYDPTCDASGEILTRIMAAAVPVVAGISLEYYFSYVDPTGYGCGTKLPHNVTSLLGVMDGAQSDLRTGLPWQMVEVHEPVRLSIVVEAPLDRIRQVVGGNPGIERLVRNRWVWLASLDPDSGSLTELPTGADVVRTADHLLPVVRGESADWYRGKTGFVSPAAIVTTSA